MEKRRRKKWKQEFKKIFMFIPTLFTVVKI